MTADAQMHLVVTGLLRRGDRVLLGHRTPSRRWYPDCWDLPGGHIEDGESPAEALRRELFEELGVTAVISGAPLAQIEGKNLHIDVWTVDEWDGEVANVAPQEHDALGWFTTEELAGLRLAHTRLLTIVETALGLHLSAHGRGGRRRSMQG